MLLSQISQFDFAGEKKSQIDDDLIFLDGSLMFMVHLAALRTLCLLRSRSLQLMAAFLAYPSRSLLKQGQPFDPGRPEKPIFLAKSGFEAGHRPNQRFPFRSNEFRFRPIFVSTSSSTK